MTYNSLLFLLSLHLFLTIFASVTADANPSLYTSFVQCLAQNHISKTDISKIVYNPNTPSFTTVLQSLIRNRRFSLPSTPKPFLIVAPTEEPHVTAAVLCAKNLNILLKPRSGGHDYEGLSYVSNSTFAVLDMFNFRSIDVDLPSGTAWVGAGALLGELYYRIFEKSKLLGFPAGVCPTVGVGGTISGGGYGNMIRRHGLSSDHVVDAKIVVATGAVLDRRSMGEDLFWAIRGGGAASFGVVLAYKINLVSVPETVTVFRLERYMSDNMAQIVHQYQQMVYDMDDDLFVRVLLQPVTRNRTRTARATFIGMFLGNATRLTGITDSIFPLLGLKKTDCNEMPWINSVAFWAFNNLTSPPEDLLSRTPDSVNFLKRKSDYVKSAISVDNLMAIFNKMIEIGRVGMVFNSYGGRMKEIPESKTPFPHRKNNLFKIQYSINWNDDEGESAVDEYIKQIRELYSFMTPYVSSNPRESYLNYRDLDIGTTDNGKNSYNEGKVYGLKYFKGNFDRLVKIKTAVDPGNLFRNEQSIPVSPAKASRGRKTNTVN